MKKYRIYSPDGFDISMDQYEYTAKEIQQALKDFQARFVTQGYYSTSDRTKIPFNEIIKCCEVVELN